MSNPSPTLLPLIPCGNPDASNLSTTRTKRQSRCTISCNTISEISIGAKSSAKSRCFVPLPPCRSTTPRSTDLGRLL